MVVSEFLDSETVLVCFKEKAADAAISIISILVVLFAAHVMVHS